MQRVDEGTQRPQSVHRALRRIDNDHPRTNFWRGHPHRNIRHAPVGQENSPHLFSSLAAPTVDANLGIGERMERITDGDGLRTQNVSSV